MLTQLTGPLQVAAQGLYESKADALHNVGEYIMSNDGRGYRFCKAGGTTLVIARTQQAKAEDTTNEQEITITNAAIGDLTIVSTDSVTLAANLLAGGSLLVSEGTLGVGQLLKLKGNTAASSAVVTFNLEEPVRVATTGTAKVDVHVNPYMSIIVSPTTKSSGPVGVAQFPITTLEFGWVQTHGIAGIYAQGTVVVGNDLVSAETTTAGGVVSRADASLAATVGYALHGAATGDIALVFLTID